MFTVNVRVFVGGVPCAGRGSIVTFRCDWLQWRTLRQVGGFQSPRLVPMMFLYFWQSFLAIG